MKKKIAEKMAQNEAQVRLRELKRQAAQQKTEAAKPRFEPVQTVPEPKSEREPDEVIKQIAAEEKAIVPRASNGQFLKRRSQEGKAAIRERAEALVEKIQDLLEAPQTALEIQETDSLHEVLIKTMIRDMQAADPDKQLGGKAKIAEALWKAARVYEKEDVQKGLKNITFVFPSIESMQKIMMHPEILPAQDKAPPIKPSWVEGQIIESNPPQNVDQPGEEDDLLNLSSEELIRRHKTKGEYSG